MLCLKTRIKSMTLAFIISIQYCPGIFKKYSEGKQEQSGRKEQETMYFQREQYPQKLLELISEFQKLARYEIIKHTAIAFICTISKQLQLKLESIIHSNIKTMK